MMPGQRHSLGIRSDLGLPDNYDEGCTVNILPSEALILGMYPQAGQVGTGTAFFKNRKTCLGKHPQPVAALDPIEVLDAVFAPKPPLRLRIRQILFGAGGSVIHREVVLDIYAVDSNSPPLPIR